MTEAEIEKQAEEYADNKYYCNQLECIQGNSCDYCYYGECKQAFKDGAKWGMEHSIEWHDLRKDQNDLPKRENERFSWSITVSNQLGEACHYNYRKSRWETAVFTPIEGVNAWCELPQFKE